MIRFHKYHALGNDYLVLDPADHAESLSDRQIRLICHRNFGLGSDGILRGPLPSPKAAFGLRIFNPDGSEAEKSGNGLRIFCRYLFDTGKVQSELPFTVETPGGVVSAVVHGAGEMITVEMGKVSFDSTVIPVTGPAREVLDESMEVCGTSYRYYAATIGNPHCVLPMESVSEELARKIGPHIETDPRFPHRTNVQLLQILDRNNIRIEIWERGAGYTLASGSSSSAAGAVARKMGAVDEAITVHMPGGIIDLRIDDAFNVRMRGPVTHVATMMFDAAAYDNASVQ